ncbi:UNVERIFIED_CONTAM: hypothetical protein GTU68_001760 [Idotea baltica]|nr:hypothetical protein [Idotea baltica]
MEFEGILLILALVFGLYMAWGIGANDVANAMATSVGSKALTVKHAIIIAAIFEFLGAFLAGGEVTSTIRKGIIDAGMIDDPNTMIFGMLAALLAAAVWLTVASRFGWPVSTTHSIVGAIVGFALVAVGMEAVHWDKLGTIAASWIVSPLLSGHDRLFVDTSVQKLNSTPTIQKLRARKVCASTIFLTAMIIGLVTFLKGLKHIGLDVTGDQAILFSMGIALVVTLVGIVFIRRLPRADKPELEDFAFANVERIFIVLMVVTACAMAFAHGSNDVANAIGPVAAIVSIVNTGEIGQKSAVPVYVLLLGAVGIVVGLATFGRRVMAWAMVGNRMHELPRPRLCLTWLPAPACCRLPWHWVAYRPPTRLLGRSLRVGDCARDWMR